MNLVLNNLCDKNPEMAIQQIQCCWVSVQDFIGSKLKSKSKNKQEVTETTYTYTSSCSGFEDSDIVVKVREDKPGQDSYCCSVIS